MFLTWRCSKLCQFTPCTIHSPTCDSPLLCLTPAAEGSPPSLHIRLRQQHFKDKSPQLQAHTEDLCQDYNYPLSTFLLPAKKTRRTSMRDPPWDPVSWRQPANLWRFTATDRQCRLHTLLLQHTNRVRNFLVLQCTYKTGDDFAPVWMLKTRTSIAHSYLHSL